MVVIKVDRKPTCWDCKLSFKDYGYTGDYNTPPEPATVECYCPDVDIDLLEGNDWNEDAMPGICGHFEPLMINECRECKKELNIPEWSWKLWVHEWIDFAVCSEECQKKLQNKIRDEEMEP